MFSSWASALQDAVQGAVTSAQEVAAEATKEFFEIESSPPPKNVVGSSSQSDKCDVLELVASPHSIPSRQWSIVLDVAFRDGNFFVIPPSRTLQMSEKALSECGMLDACKCEPVLENLDKCEGLASLAQNEALAKMHYEVMPRYVGDEQFWQHTIWRLSVLKKCATVDQALSLYEAITAEDSVTFSQPRQRLHGVDNKAPCTELRSRVAEDKNECEWLDTKVHTASELLKNASNSCRLLSAFVAKDEHSELADSVFESCKYHKGKLAAALGDLEAYTERLRGTVLDASGGEVYTDIITLNSELSAALSRYFQQAEGTDKVNVTPSPTSEGLGSDKTIGDGVHIDAMSAVSTSRSPLNNIETIASPTVRDRASGPTDVGCGRPTNTCVAKGSSDGAAVDFDGADGTVGGAVESDDEFKVELPWSDDDDE